jgi:hypothetical protein
MEMRTCPHCGVRVPVLAHGNCPNCGKALGEVPAERDGTANPFASPEASTPAATTAVADSPVVRRLKRSTGDDLVYSALLATLVGFVFAGPILDIVSIFLLVRVKLSGAKPSRFCVFIAIPLLLFNAFRLGAFLWVLAGLPTGVRPSG